MTTQRRHRLYHLQQPRICDTQKTEGKKKKDVIFQNFLRYIYETENWVGAEIEIN